MSVSLKGKFLWFSLLLIRRILKGKELIFFKFSNRFTSVKVIGIFYAAHNQNVMRFNFPMAIQNTASFESGNEYRAPPPSPPPPLPPLLQLLKITDTFPPPPPFLQLLKMINTFPCLPSSSSSSSSSFAVTQVVCYVVFKCGNRELTLKCKLKCYEKPMKDPVGVTPSKGNQGTTRGKEKFLLTSVGIEPTTSGLDLPLLCRLSYEVGQRKSGTI